MLEHILGLMQQSDHHRNYNVDTILRCIVPPLERGQHTYLVRDGAVVAWASWAWLPECKAKAFLHDAYKLKPDDWCSGDTLVFMDFIAPGGPALALYGQLRRTFKDIPASELPGASWVRFAKHGKIVKVKNGQ